MRILLTCFACEPDRGSEEGVGWNLFAGLTRRGHHVTLVTRAACAEQILAARRTGRPEVDWSRADVRTVDLPRAARAMFGSEPGRRFYYRLWLNRIARYVRRNLPSLRPDLIHHGTYVMLAMPTQVAHLGVPFVWNAAGGLFIPSHFRRLFTARQWLFESVRAMLHKALLRRPTLRRCLNGTACIFVPNRETIHAIPERYRPKAVVRSMVGVAPEELRTVPKPPPGDEVRLIAVGLLQPLKALPLALEALAHLVKGDVPRRVSLTIVGDGPDRLRLQVMARDLGVDGMVRFTGMLSREHVLEELDRAHILLFPSLRDSSGNAVVEAMARGLPVVCLDVGGPSTFVDSSCGRLVPYGTGTDHGWAMATAVLEMTADADTYAALSAGAVARARERFTWNTILDDIDNRYAYILAGC